MSTVVVVGDALLDRDVVGVSSRLAPDGPAPVVDVRESRDRPGGAALAALLAADDGHDVHLLAAIGDDPAGRRLRALLDGRLRVHALPLDGRTPVKARVRVGPHPLVRLDEGDGRATGPGNDGVVRDALGALADADAVLVADYGRGVTGLDAVRDALAGAARRAPLVWDPHPRGARPVPGARLVTPNAAESRTLSGIDGPDDLRTAARRAAVLVREFGATAVCVTRGASGAVLSYGEPTPLVVPAPQVTCFDPCGAGDRFASAAAGALAQGALPSEAALAAVRAAAAFVAAGGAGAVGVRPAGPPGDPADAFAVAARVRGAGGTVVATGGCFDLLHAGHIATLQAARELGDCLVVCLNSDRSVRRLKGAVRPITPQADRMRVLQALSCVDGVVVFDDDTPMPTLQRLRPDVWAKGGDYAEADLPEAQLVRSWGGTVALLPYLDGRSTTRLLTAASADGRDVRDR